MHVVSLRLFGGLLLLGACGSESATQAPAITLDDPEPTESALLITSEERWS